MEEKQLILATDCEIFFFRKAIELFKTTKKKWMNIEKRILERKENSEEILHPFFESLFFFLIFSLRDKKEKNTTQFRKKNT